MRSTFIITKVNHYDMGDNRGLSVRVVGSKAMTNNSFGLDISEATIPDYMELKTLSQHSGDLPAKFDADLSLVSIKGKDGKERQGVALSNLEFLNSVEFVDKVPAKK